jgi:hypothetical protein
MQTQEGGQEPLLFGCFAVSCLVSVLSYRVHIVSLAPRICPSAQELAGVYGVPDILPGYQVRAPRGHPSLIHHSGTWAQFYPLVPSLCPKTESLCRSVLCPPCYRH